MNRRSRIFLLVVIALGAATFVLCGPRAKRNAWPITNPQPTGQTIVALGDSLTRGYAMGPGESYPAQLSRRLGRPIINAGVNGDTTEEALRRLETDVVAHRPRIVLVCLGGNDMTRRLPIETAVGNLRRIVERLHRAGALVVLIGIEGDGIVYPSDQGKHFEQLARETGCVYVPDFMRGVLGRPSLMNDPLHPNAKGYEVIAERLMEEAGDYLKR